MVAMVLMKVFLMMILFSIYIKTENNLFSAIAWGILTTSVNFIFLSWGWTLALGALSFFVALGTFTLATYLEESMWRVVVLLIGMGLMVFI